MQNRGRKLRIDDMYRKLPFWGKIANVTYTVFTIVIIAALLTLWAEAGFVVMVVVVCIVFLPILAVWIAPKKHTGYPRVSGRFRELKGGSIRRK